MMDNEIKVKKRQSNIEFLRIICIIMIIFYHMSNYSNINLKTQNISFNKVYFQFIQSGGKVAVNVFMIITGYFNIKKDRLNIKKMLMLWGEMFFYSIGIYTVFVLIGGTNFNIKDFIKCCLPLISEQWWFASCYLLILLFSRIC